ncbi:unnamed protein product, partial [Iphiclides podalirius]
MRERRRRRTGVVVAGPHQKANPGLSPFSLCVFPRVGRAVAPRGAFGPAPPRPRPFPAGNLDPAGATHIYNSTRRRYTSMGASYRIYIAYIRRRGRPLGRSRTWRKTLLLRSGARPAPPTVHGTLRYPAAR